MRSVAAVVDADAEQLAERSRLAREAIGGLGRHVLGTQHRPTGPTGPTAALASLPDELDWLLSFLSPSAEPVALELACAEDEEAVTAAAVLRASAERLARRDVRPDFARLDAARTAVARALVRRLPELPSDTPSGGVPRALGAPFRIRAATYSVLQVAGYALARDRSAGARSARRRAPAGACGRGGDRAARPRARQHGLSLVPEQRPRRGRARDRRLHRATDGPPARVLGGARDAVGASVKRARDRPVDPQRARGDRRRHRHRRPARDRHRHAPAGPVGRAPRRNSARRLRAARNLVRGGPSGLHGGPLHSLQPDPAGRLEGWAGPCRGRRDRLRDQPWSRPSVLAARCGRASAGGSCRRIRARRGLRRRRGPAADREMAPRTQPAQPTLPATDSTTPSGNTSQSARQQR
jgi:hypothetical protein